jgi:mannose-1-phosphate guanylyltransferase
MGDVTELWGLVLAGGDGTRVQVLTRLISGAPIPKQYCRIIGRRSLLEATLARIEPLARRERTAVIVNRRWEALARRQLGPSRPGTSSYSRGTWTPARACW